MKLDTDGELTGVINQAVWGAHLVSSREQLEEIPWNHRFMQVMVTRLKRAIYCRAIPSQVMPSGMGNHQ